jgi:hypothetical protein
VKASALTQEIAQHQQLRPSGQDAHHKHSPRLCAVLDLKETMEVEVVYRVSTVLCITHRLLLRRVLSVPSNTPQNAPRKFSNEPIALGTYLALLVRFLGQWLASPCRRRDADDYVLPRVDKKVVLTKRVEM